MLIGLCVATVCAGTTACDVSEDESDCVANMQLTFSFTKDGTEHFGTEVPSLSVFVYDDGERFAGRWDENDNSKFSTDYTMTLPLPPGTYSFVVWGGLKDNHYGVCCGGNPASPIVGETLKGDMLLRVAGSGGHTVDYIPSALFHGATLPKTIKANADNKITVDLTKNSKQIRLTILGLPLPTRANPFTQMSMWLDAANGGYTFAGNAIESGCPLYTYHGCEMDGGSGNSLVGSIYTFQLKLRESDGVTAKPHRFVLWDSGKDGVYYEEDILHEIINKVAAYNSQSKIDAEDFFDVEIDLTPNAAVTVRVNGWTVNGYNGDLQ